MNAFDVSSLERGRKVKVLDRSVVIPSYYELLDESPFGFHDMDEGNCPPSRMTRGRLMRFVQSRLRPRRSKRLCLTMTFNICLTSADGTWAKSKVWSRSIPDARRAAIVTFTAL